MSAGPGARARGTQQGWTAHAAGPGAGPTPPPAARDLITEQAHHNRTWTVVLIVAAALNGGLLAVMVGGAFGAAAGLIAAPALMLACVGITFLVYESTLLRSTGARVPRPDEARLLVPLVGALAARMGMAMPQVLVMDDEAANAFAIGRGPRHGTIVFTSGILGLLDRDQLEAVTGHELAHIANGDTRISMLSAALLGWALLVSTIGTIIAMTLAVLGVGFLGGSGGSRDLTGLLTGLLFGIVLIATAVTAWVLLQGWVLIARITDLGIHRQREWLADATSAQVTGNPRALAAALERLESATVTVTHGRRLAQSLCVAGEPLTGSWWRDLMSTHPASGRRIERLMEMASAPAAPSSPGSQLASGGPAPTDDLAPARQRPGARLGLQIAGTPLPEVWITPDRAVLVGRGPDADVRLEDPTVSRKHLEIRVDGAVWMLRDLGARNPAVLLDATGATRSIAPQGSEVHAGQVIVGRALVTLYPQAPSPAPDGRPPVQ